jgi:hypothetical protein
VDNHVEQIIKKDITKMLGQSDTAGMSDQELDECISMIGDIEEKLGLMGLDLKGTTIGAGKEVYCKEQRRRNPEHAKGVNEIKDKYPWMNKGDKERGKAAPARGRSGLGNF